MAQPTSYTQPLDAYELAGAPMPTTPLAVTPEFAPEYAPDYALEYAPEPAEAPRAVPVKASACNIVVRRTSNGVLLKAVADLNRTTYGEYSFVITKIGRAGSSDINQGGPFEGRAGRHIELAASELSVERGSGYRATLKLRANGREICRDTVRS
jgi:hypothetical protein